jgi:hypothetical protein
MFDKIKRLIPAVALLASLLVSLPIAQSQASVNVKQKVCSTRGSASSRLAVRLPYASPAYNRQAAYQIMSKSYGWCGAEYTCLVTLWNHESGWKVQAHNPSGAHGIPQSLPGSKMSRYGADWRTNPITQINWGLHYIKVRYGTPCQAWGFWQTHRWY